MVSSKSLFWILFGAGVAIALIDQFAMHGTSFELTPISHSTWMDGCAAGLLISAWTTRLLKRA